MTDKLFPALLALVTAFIIYSAYSIPYGLETLFAVVLVSTTLAMGLAALVSYQEAHRETVAIHIHPDPR